MVRKKRTILPEHLQLLRERLEQTFGRPVQQSVHCDHLSAHIRQTIQESVSAQTLRRIFGFIASPYLPSATNLDLLSYYCGYTGWADLTSGSAATGAGFRPLSAADEAAHYLSLYRIELKDEGDINYHNACRNVAERILTSPALFQRMAAPLASLPVARIFFYERFPYIDGLGGHYNRGLQLYLRRSTGVPQRIFGRSLLLLGALLRGQTAATLPHLLFLRQQVPQRGWHPFVVARLLGSRLLAATLAGDEARRAADLREMMRWSRVFAQPSRIHFWYFPYYQLLMCDYLNLAGLFDWSRQLMQPVLSRPGDRYEIERGYAELWEIVQRIAASDTEPAAFVQWAGRFDGWSRISVIFRQYYRLQVLARVHALRPGKKREREALAQLVKATGFTFFLP